MFNLFKKPAKIGEELIFKIDGMHCTACSLNIDDTLEELDGVIAAKTSYPKSTTTVTFDPAKITSAIIIKAIKQTGYQAKSI